MRIEYGSGDKEGDENSDIDDVCDPNLGDQASGEFTEIEDTTDDCDLSRGDQVSEEFIVAVDITDSLLDGLLYIVGIPGADSPSPDMAVASLDC